MNIYYAKFVMYVLSHEIKISSKPTYIFSEKSIECPLSFLLADSK